MSEEKGLVKGFLLGILAGGITGSLIALLYAPKSGIELRRDIANKKNELLEEAEEYLEHAKTSANEMLAEGKKKAAELVEDAKKKAGEISQGTTDLYNSGKDKITKIKDALKSGVDAYNEEREKGEREKGMSSAEPSNSSR